MPSTSQVYYRACNLCEAICGLEITVSDNQVQSIKGDKNDPFSRGHICPKATALKDIHEDPNRLRHPHKKVDGEWVQISWDEAFDEVVDRLWETRQEHGQNAVGVYLGNPNVHNYGSLTHGPQFYRLLKTQNRFSATSVDQLPHQLISYLMYGHQFLIPIPDIDHTDYFLIMGANPAVSNGSIMTAPDVKKRIKDIRARGGKVTVIDPRHTETAKISDEHHFIKPGTDIFFLISFIHSLIKHKLINKDEIYINNNQLNDLINVLDYFKEDDYSDLTGISQASIDQLAREFAEAPSAVFYGRLGVSTNPYGSLCHWLIQVINILTGNLDQTGGAMLPEPAIDLVGMGLIGKGGHNRWQSRVRGVPEACSELSASVMAEEITTPGDGQIKTMITAAGNPILSTPNGRTLDQAMAELDFMVSIDIYINETTRHADIILPPTSPLEHDHYDLSFLGLAIRNTSRFSDAVVTPEEDTRHDWEIFHELTERYMQKMGPNAIIPKHSPAQLVNLGLAFGPYGRKRKHPLALSLRKLRQDHPHGIDIGPLKSNLKQTIKTPDKEINLIPDIIGQDLERLKNDLPGLRAQNGLLLIGRRDIRSNNSWMHNYHRLVKGADRCTLLVHPDDATTHQLNDGDKALIASRVGTVEITVEITTDMMPGTVSLPHGWGHNKADTQMDIANAHSGVSVNDLTDDILLDELAGTAAVNAVPVTLSPLP